MPNVADLVGAADPLDFFRDNVVMVSYSMAQRNTAQVHPMWMADGWRASPTMDLGWTGQDAGKNAIPLVTIMNYNGAQGATFDALWCPYQAGTMQQVMLTNQADFMFTAKMDGCTFAVGSEDAQHQRIACHVNLGGQGQEQADLVKGLTSPLHGDRHAAYLGPAAYRFVVNGDKFTQATTFGIRTAAGSWEIWTQICLFKRASKTIRLKELRRVG